MDRPVTLKQEEISGHELQSGLDIKTDRLTDHQSQCDFDFYFWMNSRIVQVDQFYPLHSSTSLRWWIVVIWQTLRVLTLASTVNLGNGVGIIVFWDFVIRKNTAFRKLDLFPSSVNKEGRCLLKLVQWLTAQSTSWLTQVRNRSSFQNARLWTQSWVWTLYKYVLTGTEILLADKGLEFEPSEEHRGTHISILELHRGFWLARVRLPYRRREKHCGALGRLQQPRTCSTELKKWLTLWSPGTRGLPNILWDPKVYY
jgi:hypothetical protein